RRAGFTPRLAPAPLATSIVLLLEMVAAGLGVSLLADSYRGLRHDGVSYVPLSGPAPSRLLMVWRRDGLSACGAWLLEVARQRRPSMAEPAVTLHLTAPGRR